MHTIKDWFHTNFNFRVLLILFKLEAWWWPFRVQFRVSMKRSHFMCYFTTWSCQ